MPMTMLVARRLHNQTQRSFVMPLPFQVWFPLVVYGISRLITAAFMLAAPVSLQHGGYSDLATTWDGEWYRAIAAHGYPSVLPIGVDGHVERNAWAFSPAYPMLVRALMAMTGLDFSLVAPTVSIALGAAAMVVIFVLMERAVSRFTAGACVLLICTFMSSPVFQLAYAESLALLLLAGALLLLRERRYWLVAPLILALALTRPVVLAFIPVVVAHGVSRWVGRETDPFSRRDQKVVAFLAGWCIAATALWPVIAALGTRNTFAWILTQENWWNGPHFAPGLGWPASLLFNYGWPALAALAVIVLLTLGIILRPGARAWGTELRSWSIAYPSFLLLGTAAGSSVIRWMVLAFPLLWPFPEASPSRSERRFRVVLIALLAIVGLGMQWVWVSTFLASTSPSDRVP